MLTLLTTLLVASNVFFWLGSGGVQMGGSSISFNREGDARLYSVAPGFALRTTDGEWFDLVTIKRGPFPVCPVCGIWTRDEYLVHYVAFVSGDWYIARYVGPNGAEAFNVVTGETIEIAGGPGSVMNDDGTPNLEVVTRSDAASTDDVKDQPEATPGVEKPGSGASNVNAAQPPSPPAAAAVEAALPGGQSGPFATQATPVSIDGATRISAIGESCIVFNGAFIILYFLLGLPALYFLVFGKPRA
jgi:hypothetical protein